MAEGPLPTEVSHGLCDGNGERGAVVQHDGPDLKFGDLAVEIPRHEPRPRQGHTRAQGADRLNRELGRDPDADPALIAGHVLRPAGVEESEIT